jgi:MFS family permease
MSCSLIHLHRRYILRAYDSEEETTIDEWWKGFLAAAVFIGMLVGGLACGVLSDKAGRRPLLLASMGINAVAGVASAFAPSLASLVACRVIAGVGIGGSVPCVFTMCAETIPKKARGRFLVAIAWHWMLVGSASLHY